METHDELLEAAVAAHRELEQAKELRKSAFLKALRGPVKGREIAEATGLSESQVGRIARG
ncbi:TPA: hypothetical protein NJV00_000851 [Corynebacterium striatum]|nr:hypothetical protein [Corynebacterium striatum]HAT1159099.1 hypothetical protein [Corynebacterium striatum]HAT1161959.1 hypothetical protein [Corynebacterium striatum]HAT1164712.1 hypothetical protein [Corynebacterium striatum]HAT1277869.1 hypothetical protein [Corynebacterium striatum]